MTWWEWALLIVWGPGTLLAVLITLGIAVQLIRDRGRHSKSLGGDDPMSQTPHPA